jgi:nicotinate-nucleotide adenylyltransferase
LNPGRIGLLGGSFDPPHFGHLHVARSAREELGLDRVRLIPAARPPHKLGRTLAEDRHRLAMLELLKGSTEWLEIDPRELQRGGTSFTYETLIELRRELAPIDHRREPAPAAPRNAAKPFELFFLIGSDSLVDLPGWHRAADLVELATFVTVPRDAESLDLGREKVRRHLPFAADRVLAHVLDAEILPISSSQIRARVAAGLPIVELVPKAVAEYIDAHHLYHHPEATGAAG